MKSRKMKKIKNFEIEPQGLWNKIRQASKTSIRQDFVYTLRLEYNKTSYAILNIVETTI